MEWLWWSVSRSGRFLWTKILSRARSKKRHAIRIIPAEPYLPPYRVTNCLVASFFILAFSFPFLDFLFYLTYISSILSLSLSFHLFFLYPRVALCLRRWYEPYNQPISNRGTPFAPTCLYRLLYWTLLQLNYHGTINWMGVRRGQSKP